MTPAAFEAVALALPGATLSVQWGDDHVFKVGGKMFAVAAGTGVSCSFKVTEIAYEALKESGRARRAPYMQESACWVFFDDLAALDDAEVADWLKTSHALVSAKLTRAQRGALGL